MSAYSGQTWEPVRGLFVLERYDDRGFGWNVVALKLSDGGLLLYSPSWLGPETFARLDALGPVRAMLVPSAFHYLAVPRFRERYPDALVCASEGARPRLGRKGLKDLSPLDALAPLLPPEAVVVTPDGFKTGEAWLSVEVDGIRTWVVCDAFMNVERELKGFVGAIIRRVLRIHRGRLSIPATMRWLHLRDVKGFRRYVQQLSVAERPTCLVVTHGAPLTALDLPERLQMLVEHSL